jgi:chemotaxis family two-component system response regulator Rcp1
MSRVLCPDVNEVDPGIQGQGLVSTLPEFTQKKTTPFVVLVEDNPVDVLLVGRAMEVNQVPARLLPFEDGEAAVRYLEQVESDLTAPCPGLLLLDLNLPKKPGVEILRWARASTRCKGVPILILTSSDSPQDRETAARLGANRYFRKPISYHEFLKVGELINELLMRSSSATS